MDLDIFTAMKVAQVLNVEGCVSLTDGVERVRTANKMIGVWKDYAAGRPSFKSILGWNQQHSNLRICSYADGSCIEVRPNKSGEFGFSICVVIPHVP